MGEQKHVHYTKPTFGQKVLYAGIGFGIYWLTFAGGCEKVKQYMNESKLEQKVNENGNRLQDGN